MLYVALIIPDRLFFFLSHRNYYTFSDSFFCIVNDTTAGFSPVVIAENDLRCDAYLDFARCSRASNSLDLARGEMLDLAAALYHTEPDLSSPSSPFLLLNLRLSRVLQSRMIVAL